MSDAEADQAPVLTAFAARADKRIDTQGAVVFLIGDEAVKIRRAIRLPFLDYSTLEKRRAAAQAEIALNQAQAPQIYKEAAAVRRTGDGFGFAGEGEIVDWATRMRRFDENATLDRLPREALTEDLVRALAHAIAHMHERAERRAAGPAMAAMARWIEQNAQSFAARPDLFDKAKVVALAEALRAALEAVKPLLSERGARGWVRRCHGDLHLGNIVVIEGKPVPFDAIEFDDEIATGDVLYDLSFAVMDLWERDRRAEANVLLNAYLAQGSVANEAGPRRPAPGSPYGRGRQGEVEPCGNFDALAALPLFLSLRAAIRAKVEANALEHLAEPARGEKAQAAKRYFEFAQKFLTPEPARLVAVGGLSGTGKSVLARALAPEIGRAPGAVWLRSDVERKAMFGVSEDTHLPAEAYSAAASEAVYARLLDTAERALKAGAGVLLDATHAHAAERMAATALAAQTGAPFVGLWLEAPLEIRLRRVNGRRGDASDADTEVAARQRAEPLIEAGWRALDASGDAGRVATLARTCI